MSSPIHCTLSRLTEGDEGTFGTFDVPELLFTCVTLELPDRNNTPMLSRIPAGVYPALWSYSNRFKRMHYRLDATAPRVGILIHPANFAGDVKKGYFSELSGCIALGRARCVLEVPDGAAQSAINDSRAKVAEFEAATRQRPLLIRIVDVPRETLEPVKN